MIIVQGWVRFGAGEIGKIGEAARAMITATRASPGCIDYAYAVDLLEPDLLRVSELWADEESLNAHAASPHMAALNAGLAQVAITGASVRVYAGDYVRTAIGT